MMIIQMIITMKVLKFQTNPVNKKVKVLISQKYSQKLTIIKVKVKIKKKKASVSASKIQKNKVCKIPKKIQ